jgi:poly [ADP-ribose] polymerase 2/3/4
MFGKGVYLADISTKSANYCCSYASGGTGLLLLCEAELGAPPLKLSTSDSNAGENAKKQGCISTWGVGMTAPKGWKDAGCLHEDLKGVKIPDVSTEPGNTGEGAAYLQYNEYIVYDVSQVRLRYLLRVQM